MVNRHNYQYQLDEGCTVLATDVSCCNNKPGGCGENEGDCDNESHCKAGLKCGTDNCPSSFPSDYDCCYKGRPRPGTHPDPPPGPGPQYETMFEFIQNSSTLIKAQNFSC